MKYKSFRDKKHRRYIANNEILRTTYKSLACNSLIPKYASFRARLQLQKLPRKGSLIKIQNRCIISARAHSVFRDFKLSRITFRELVSTGVLPGIRKSSW